MESDEKTQCDKNSINVWLNWVLLNWVHNESDLRAIRDSEVE